MWHSSSEWSCDASKNINWESTFWLCSAHSAISASSPSRGILDYSDDQKDDFYTQLQNDVDQVASKDVRIIGGDFDARRFPILCLTKKTPIRPHEWPSVDIMLINLILLIVDPWVLVPSPVPSRNNPNSPTIMPTGLSCKPRFYDVHILRSVLPNSHYLASVVIYALR